MSTPTDLRRTLSEHSHDLDAATTLPVGDRLQQVHGRVRGVRRRRRAAGAGVAASVVATAGVVALLPRSDVDPVAAGRQDLAGHDAPATMTSLGFTYAFERAQEAAGEAAIWLPASDRPRLLSWSASSDDPVRVQVEEDLDRDGTSPDTLTSVATAFSDFYYVSPTTFGSVYYVRADEGQVAAAVYELDSPPAGPAAGEAFFRQEVAGATLVASAFGETGDAAVSVEFTMPERLSISAYCAVLSAG